MLNQKMENYIDYLKIRSLVPKQNISEVVSMEFGKFVAIFEYSSCRYKKAIFAESS